MKTIFANNKKMKKSYIENEHNYEVIVKSSILRNNRYMVIKVEKMSGTRAKNDWNYLVNGIWSI